MPCTKVIKTLIGFDEFGGRDEFRTAELAMCLAKCRIIQVRPFMAVVSEFAARGARIWPLGVGCRCRVRVRVWV